MYFIQKKFLEDKMNKNRQRMNEVDDIVTENEDLQEALLKKDKTMEAFITPVHLSLYTLEQR